jgi:hypothetical protein
MTKGRGTLRRTGSLKLVKFSAILRLVRQRMGNRNIGIGNKCQRTPTFVAPIMLLHKQRDREDRDHY